MYTDKTKILEQSPLPSHHFFLRRALVKTIFKQIESWSSSKDEKATETGDNLDSISSEEKLSLIQLWKQCAFLSDLLKTSQENLRSKQTSTCLVQSSVLSMMSPSSKYESSTDDQKSSSSSNSVKLLFNNKVQTDSSLAEGIACNHSNKKRKRRKVTFQWLYRHLMLRMRSRRKSKSTQHSETFDKLLQTPTREDNGGEVNGPPEVLKNEFETCRKCGRLDLYKPLTHNEVDTIKMLIKMEAKQNYRQINIIIKELNEHKNEIKKLNSIFKDLTHDCIKKRRGTSDVDLQGDIKALYEKCQKLSQKYNEIEQKATNVLKRPSEDSSKSSNKSKIPIKSNKTVYRSKQGGLADSPTRVEEKDTKNLINISQRKYAPKPSDQPQSSKTSNASSKNASIIEKSSSELSLFKEHIVYSATGDSKMMMIRDSKEKIYYFPKEDISKIVIQKLIDVMEKEKNDGMTKKSSAVCVRCEKQSENESLTSKNVFGFIKRLCKKSNHPNL